MFTSQYAFSPNCIFLKPKRRSLRVLPQACPRRIPSALQDKLPDPDSDPSSESDASSAPRNDAKSSAPFYGRSVSTLAKRIAEARDRFQKVSDEVRALQSSPEGFVLGSDLSNFYIGSTSLIQDLEIPAAPKYWALLPEKVIATVLAYLDQNSVPQSQQKELVDILAQILAALRGWMHEFADKARPLLASDDNGRENNSRSDSLDAFITLLQMAGFSILPELSEITEPPSPEALPLGNSIAETLDPTLLQQSTAIRNHIARNGVRLGHPCYYPYLFIATRGVSLVRRSGLLIPQKIRAIERSYFSWIRTPFAVLLQPIRVLAISTKKAMLSGFNRQTVMNAGLLDKVDSAMERISPEEGNGVESAETAQSQNEHLNGKRVRRVVPAVQLDGGWDALNRLFLPTFTQEPSHELMVLLYQEVVPDKNSIRREKRAALIQQMKDSVMQAINPIPPKRREAARAATDTQASVLDNFERPPGAVKPVSLEMFTGVPWGTINHFFPSTFVLPATRDLLRIDALTFIGLLSTFVTYARHSDSAFIFAFLAGSVVSYSVRVAFGWRQALLAYKGKIANDKASRVVSRHRSCLDSLAALSAEEMFLEVSCVWLSKALKKGKKAQDLQREVFQDVSLTDDAVKSWTAWLEASGF